MHVALLGAFSFPAPQGSQVFLRDQARALEREGVRVSVLCYGGGEGPDPGLPVIRAPRWISPRGYRSGLHPAKPFADLALALRTARFARDRGVDAVLAHNAEAALLALLARGIGGAPTVYVAHTLVEEELSAYLGSAADRTIARAGAGLDRFVARRADAAIVLSEEARRRLARVARGEVALVPPGVEALPPPSEAEVRAACARHGLRPGGFALYAGNLDAYQEIGALRETARRLPGIPFAVATHADAPADLSPLRVLAVAPEELRALTHGAAVAVATRRRRGGFPIKLLNYMEAGRAIVAREGQAATLRHGENAWLVADDAGPAEIAAAVEALWRDRERARSLGRAARATALRCHRWPQLARRTLDVVGRVLHADEAVL